MNSIQPAIVLTTILFVATARAADPQLDSWFTTASGQYARLYATDADKSSGNAVTTWSRGTLSQSTPAYCGVHEVYYSASWVYLRTSGLGSHTMGPWYLNAGHTTLFPNVPINTKTLYRIPRAPATNGTHTLTGLGAIGYFVDGVAMFDSRDAFYWNGSAEVQGSGSWNRDAWVNEGVTFDPGNAHQPGSGAYHYHANPPALRYELGDHVDYNAATKTYSESTNAVTKHSPILGWMRDGFPVYGPYGYSTATNPASGVRRMISGYTLRNGSNGADNLTTTGRTAIPAWATRASESAATGPTVSTTYPLGRYLEDNAYLGDLINPVTGSNFVQGVDFDLNEWNTRWCVTPEFPGGTWAYFVSVSSNGTPAFPYNVSRTFFGNPTGNTTTLSEAVTTNFVGGANSSLAMSAPVVSNNIVTLTWSATEGGTYRVEASGNLSTWTTNATGIPAVLNKGTSTTAKLATNQFFRVTRTALATYDP
ncbi:MAG: YHYH protein [Pedosphaera sp.]|nr:YHYH protein [Pedosphaera sp.]